MRSFFVLGGARAKLTQEIEKVTIFLGALIFSGKVE
jgi:hypothetical protein